MKSALVIVVLFSFLIVNLSKSIVLANYELNKKEITEKYCVNKDKPQMHCCGKCYLKKKLAEQEAQKESPVFPDIKTDIQLYYSGGIDFLKPQNNSQYTFISSNNSLRSLFEGTDIFHPPSC